MEQSEQSQKPYQPFPSPHDKNHSLLVRHYNSTPERHQSYTCTLGPAHNLGRPGSPNNPLPPSPMKPTYHPPGEGETAIIHISLPRPVQWHGLLLLANFVPQSRPHSPCTTPPPPPLCTPPCHFPAFRTFPQKWCTPAVASGSKTPKRSGDFVSESKTDRQNKNSNQPRLTNQPARTI